MRSRHLVILVLTTALMGSPLAAQQLRQPPDANGRIAPPITRFTPLRADIQFDDGSLFRVLTQRDTVRAELRVLGDGSGLLSGTWEISEPGISGFRPLARVRVPSAGRQLRVLVSPAMPVSRPGLYELRFRPASGAATRPIFYSVVPIPRDTGAEVVLLAPQPGLRILAETVFRWAPVAGATVYRLEILSAQTRLVAVDVTRETAHLHPRALARLRRQAGPLDWRVTAYDAQGRILGVSDSRATGGRSAR